MKTEMCFVVSESMKDLAKALGIHTGAGEDFDVLPCPYAVGDLISYPAAPGVAFRVTWRLYSHGSETKPPRWILGLEKSAHPLEDPA